ncbi:integrase core domain-containing protein [Spongiibacter taiwanensis]|uniref:integrase core domain-containing protein n=1 Tax=Spongiibacter taiwanensis TaxID=1748242 RepID=UPI002035FA9B|nr:integrase core domain-containing protein [Spongiibacter taiwanensis]USA43522.1 integrase core domain-containing protein [Spongiibacter taiwanensis]
MPWRDVKPMDERVLFISDYLRGGRRYFAELCRCYGISRKTGYKWVERYQASGIEGLQERSRRPLHHPAAIPYAIEQAVVASRCIGRMTLGPKKIQQKLREQFPDTPVPSITSIHNILKRHGLIEARQPRRRVSPYREPFAPVAAPNDLWSVDFKGQFKLGHGPWCFPLTVMDHHSRFLLGCQGLEGTETKAAKQVFEQLFKEYGLPRRIRSDNGVPFASKAPGGLSALSVWWVRLGIVPERIKPGMPQQNGRHERMHRTMKQAVTKPVADTMAAQQHCMDIFRRDYNEQRPHESLALSVPQACYSASQRHYPERLPELEYPSYYSVMKVQRSGTIYWGGGQVYVSHSLKGERVGLEQVDDGIWDIYLGPIRLGGFNQRNIGGKAFPYWTIKV